MTRPKPRLWIPLPIDVVDARSLASYLRKYAAERAGPTPIDVSDKPPMRMLLAAAAMLDKCEAQGVRCVRAVVAECDARAVAEDLGPWGPRLYWESVAHAVERIADHLDETLPDATDESSAQTPAPENIGAGLDSSQPAAPSETQITRITALATKAFGNAEKAGRWLHARCRALDGARPVDLLVSPDGVARVERELGRIEHGIAS